MKKSFALITVLIVFVLSIVNSESVLAGYDSDVRLKYTMAGADSPYYLPEAYYQPPVVIDLNRDGKKEIIFVNYCLNVLDAETGELLWKINGGRDRSCVYETGKDTGIIWDFEVSDINGDGYYEIICAHAKGTVSVLSHEGYMLTGWPQRLCGERGAVYADARSVEVCDLDKDGVKEIIIAASVASAENVWVYDTNGRILKGWPQLASYQNAVITYDVLSGYSYGMFMDGLETGDINNDGYDEIIVPNDTQYLCVYDRYGRLIPANKTFFRGRTWGKVGLWESVATEKDMDFNEGWGWAIKGDESREERYFGTLTHGVARVCDVNNDGTNEVVVSATVIDRAKNVNKITGDYYSSRYMSVFIFNGDRTRFKGWEESPSDKNCMKAPLYQDPDSLASNVQAEPVITDLDNDGTNEIIINTYDGCVHAFSVTDSKKEFANFPYRIQQQGNAFENPGGVVCKDINGDGKKEVIFASSTDDPEHSMTHGKKGKLYILNYDGTYLAGAELPDGYKYYESQKPAYTNCSMAKPAVEDINGDGKCEIIVNTRYAGVCMYETDFFGKAYAHTHDTHISIDGNIKDVRAYIINGYNYYKLRDIAVLLKGTKKEFNIGYNNALKEVKITPKARYSPLGNELDIKDGEKFVFPSSCVLKVGNSLPVTTPYIIDGNNYFKLRDICGMIGAAVSWDEEHDTIKILTK